MSKFNQFLQEGKIKSVLDIGANQGYFSLAIRSSFPEIDILMIEANPFCDNFLKRTGIPYEIVCLSDSEKEVKFYLEDNNFIGTGASYYLEKTQWYSKQNFTQMNTKRLDDIVFKQYDLIKLDTQGSELDIMKGGIKTVDAAKYILIETSLIEYNENAPLKKEVFDYMLSIGFKPIEIVEEHVMGDSVFQEDWVFSKQG